jgi:restriction system protein
LNALVSGHPHLVEPVTPVRDFDLARYSFVESVDVVASLDSRSDLTKMTPTEFEHFVRQLFEARGLEGWTTERTGDDGVDAVVINRDPMVGGLTIVQAKRYNGVIGVSHVRELVGAMDEKRAGRGYSSRPPGSRAGAGQRPQRTVVWSLLTAHGSVISSKSI